MTRLSFSPPTRTLKQASQSSRNCLQRAGDDHANSIEGATNAAVGDSIQGEIEYEGDDDIFAFDAIEGEIYQIGVELGTLSDSWLAIIRRRIMRN